jgi:hypothetical protein
MFFSIICFSFLTRFDSLIHLFSNAFIADDDLTNQGDKDFMKYGVSLASAASFFYDAVAASAGFGGNLAEEAKILHPDPADAAKISPVAFKINNELVLEGRGSFKIQKRACSSEEKKEKEKMCSSEVDVKYWGVTKCSDEYCEVGLPVKNPDMTLTFQSWNRAELIITAPPVVRIVFFAVVVLLLLLLTSFSSSFFFFFFCYRFCTQHLDLSWNLILHSYCT